MKKPYNDLFKLTLGETENLIKCRDDNGGWMCRKGCPFHYHDGEVGCCYKNAFYSRLDRYFDEQGLISQNEDGEWEIELK